jgi:hypothetical protein
MTTGFAILLTAYLIGYFVSFGLTLGCHEEPGFGAISAAFVVSLLSWINIGIYLSDFLPHNEKIKS